MYKLSESQLQKLLNTKICFSWRQIEVPWIIEGLNKNLDRDVIAEDYACYFVRTDLFSIGAFSYSWSPLPEYVSVGRYCSIADQVEIIPFTHPTDLFTTSSMVYDPSLPPRIRYYKDLDFSNNDAVSWSHPTNNKDIVIGNDVYISRGAKLRRGITIGNGAIIGAFSVVTKDVPPYAVVVGNPARIVRFRCGEREIASLNELQWWNYDFKSVLDTALMNSIASFIDRMMILISRKDILPFCPNKNNIREIIS